MVTDATEKTELEEDVLEGTINSLSTIYRNQIFLITCVFSVFVCEGF